ncbi:MAG: Sec-independent protein translocase subunit TatA/TatB [Bacteroidales bacterium]
MIGTVLLGVIGGTEWIIIIAVVLLLFGGKKIPELMKGVGQGIREFKTGMSGETEEKKTENKSEGK